jgi:hypothetical protein
MLHMHNTNYTQSGLRHGTACIAMQRQQRHGHTAATSATHTRHAQPGTGLHSRLQYAVTTAATTPARPSSQPHRRFVFDAQARGAAMCKSARPNISSRQQCSVSMLLPPAQCSPPQRKQVVTTRRALFAYVNQQATAQPRRTPRNMKQHHAWTHTHIHTHTHARTHARTHAHTHTHTHGYTMPTNEGTSYGRACIIQPLHACVMHNLSTASTVVLHAHACSRRRFAVQHHHSQEAGVLPGATGTQAHTCWHPHLPWPACVRR